MSIHKTAQGKWRVKWREHYKQCSRTFPRKIEAEVFEAKVKSGQAKNEKPQAVLTFAAFKDLWLTDYAEVHKSASSIVNDRQVIRDYFSPRWDDRFLMNIAPIECYSLQAELARSGRLRPKTINNIMQLLHKMFDDAKQWHYLQENPAKGLKHIKLGKSTFTFWTFTERDRFLTYSKSRFPELYQAVLIAVHTGMRIGEIQGLLRDCLDFDRKEIIVRRNFCTKSRILNEHTKNKEVRRIGMNDAVLEVLKDRMLLAPNQRVFQKDIKSLVGRRFRRTCKEAGVTVLRFHDLRHTFASHLVMSGVPISFVKEELGHATVQMTERYAHLAPSSRLGVTDVLTKTEVPQLFPQRELESVTV